MLNMPHDYAIDNFVLTIKGQGIDQALYMTINSEDLADSTWQCIFNDIDHKLKERNNDN